MRILFIANTLPPVDLSGAGEQVLQLEWGLRRLGHEVRLLGRGRHGVPGSRLLFPLLAPFFAWREIARFRPDVVQVHESDGGLVALLLRLLRTRRHRPRLLALLQVSYGEERRVVRRWDFNGHQAKPTAAELRFRYLRAPVQVLLGRLSARLADLVLAPSAATGRELMRDYGVDRVEILANVTGAELPGAEGLAAPALAQAGQAGDDGEDFFLFVGRLRLRKGVEVLLAALAALRLSGLRPWLLIVGDGERRRLLEEQADRLGLAEQVRFLGRRKPAEIAGLMERARALVVPSLYEGMPLVILESMDRALPVIASAVSGIPEVVVDGETGWLVRPGDPAALAATLESAWQQPAEARRRGASGRQRIDERYRPRHAAARWLSLVGGLDPDTVRQ